mgnify:CR=1 FL=1
MSDAQAVAEGDAAHDLAEDVAHLLLAEARLRVEHVEQVAARHVLHHHQDLGVGVEHLVEPDDVRVVSNFIAQALRGDPITVYGTASKRGRSAMSTI